MAGIKNNFNNLSEQNFDIRNISLFKLKNNKKHV